MASLEGSDIYLRDHSVESGSPEPRLRTQCPQLQACGGPCTVGEKGGKIVNMNCSSHIVSLTLHRRSFVANSRHDSFNGRLWLVGRRGSNGFWIGTAGTMVPGGVALHWNAPREALCRVSTSAGYAAASTTTQDSTESWLLARRWVCRSKSGWTKIGTRRSRATSSIARHEEETVETSPGGPTKSWGTRRRTACGPIHKEKVVPFADREV